MLTYDKGAIVWVPFVDIQKSVQIVPLSFLPVNPYVARNVLIVRLTHLVIVGFPVTDCFSSPVLISLIS